MDTPAPASRREPGYLEAVTLLAGCLAGLMILQLWKAPRIPPLSPWLSAGGPLLLTGLGLLLGLRFPARPWVRFLGGLPFGISSLVTLSLAAMAGTLVVQAPASGGAPGAGGALPFLQRLGFTDVYHTFWFGVLCLLLLFCLALTAGRRCRPLDGRGLSMLAIHLGLCLTLSGGIFGTLSSLRGEVVLREGGHSDEVRLEQGGALRLPAPLGLERFVVEPHALEAALARRQEGRIEPLPSGKALPILEPGREVRLGAWTLRCLEALPNAVPGEPEVFEAAAGDPEAVLAVELALGPAGGPAQRQLLPADMMRRELPGGQGSLLFLETRPGRLDEVLAKVAGPGMGPHGALGPGLFLFSDGARLEGVWRSVQGSSKRLAMPDASGGPLRIRTPGAPGIALGPLRRVVLQERWVPAGGLLAEATGAARVVATKGPLRREGWISTGPGGAGTLPLDGDLLLMLMPPQPKAFRSELLLEGRRHTLAMNAPLSFHNWTFSQLSFQAAPGMPTLSILKAVRDDSPPLVFAGLLLVLLGTLGFLWVLPTRLRS